MRMLLGRPLAAVPFIFAPLLLAAGTEARQLPSAAVEPDTAQLRRALAEAFGGDIEIARTELSSGLYERGGTFWLVHARPRRSGDYELRYRYEYRDHVRPDNPLYTHVEHTSYIRVGEAGCWRRREGKDVCLGDTVILPFVVNDFTGHVFSVSRRPSSTGGSYAVEEAEPGPSPGADTVPNPVSAHLKYLGSRAAVMLHRRPGSTTEVSAEFEAVAPGSFNLSLAPRWPDRPQPVPSEAGSVPVVIVPRGQPVTVLLENETVEGRDEKKGFSSHSGNQYLTTALLLQPGDRISLEYLRYTSRDDHAPTHVTFGAVPVIGRFPFQLDTGERFNAWIAAHLPVSQSR